MFSYDNPILNLDKLTNVRKSVQKEMLPVDVMEDHRYSSGRRHMAIPRLPDQEGVSVPLRELQLGDRVEVSARLKQYSGRGTILRRSGFGRLLICLDSGRRCNVHDRDLLRID